MIAIDNGAENHGGETQGQLLDAMIRYAAADNIGVVLCKWGVRRPDGVRSG
jgi:hypothetical protein